MSFADIPLSSQSAPIIEFEVLWTTQKHQKNKKWHDGVLRFHTFNKRLMVYDSDGNLVCSKFHSVQRNIEVGEELVFENHLATVEEVKGQTEQNLRPLFEKTVERRQAVGRGDASSPPGTSMGSPLPPLPTARPNMAAGMSRGTLSLNRGGSRRLGLTRSASAAGFGSGRGTSTGFVGQQNQPVRAPQPAIPRTPAAQVRPPVFETPVVPVSKAAVSAFKPPMPASISRPPRLMQQEVQRQQQPQNRTVNVPIKESPSSVPNKESLAFTRVTVRDYQTPIRPPVKATPASPGPPIKESPASTRNDLIDIPSDDDVQVEEEDEDLARMAAVERTLRKNRERREAQVSNWSEIRRRKSSSPIPHQQQPTSSVPSKRGHEDTDDEDMADVTIVDNRSKWKFNASRPRANVAARSKSGSPTPRQAQEAINGEGGNEQEEDAPREPEQAAKQAKPGLLYLQSATVKEPRKMLLCQPRRTTSLSTRSISDLGMRKLSMEDEEKAAEELSKPPTKTRKGPAKKTTAAKVTKKAPAKKVTKKAAAQALEDSNNDTVEEEKPAPRARKKLKENQPKEPKEPKGKKPEPRRRQKKSPEKVELLSPPPPPPQDDAENRREADIDSEDEDLAAAIIQSSPYIGTNVFNDIESTAQAMKVPTPQPVEEEEEDPFADYPQTGPWTIEAYDLMDWRPPGKQGLWL